ncbi:MAG TPA: type II toxin-antitoxin system VapC family toxin [Chthoniobacteraceae bacterium]
MSDTARTALEHTEEKVFISVASLWEISIKLSLKKLRLRSTLHRMLEELLHGGFDLLPITANHALQVADLPMNHRDPFDRLLIVQARDYGLTVITRDAAFSEYDVQLLW